MHDDDIGVKPLTIGLLSTYERTPAQLKALKDAIARTAQAEGYSLLATFEAGVNDYGEVLDKLFRSVTAVRRGSENLRTVILPTKSDLGADIDTRLERMELIEAQDLRLLILR
jgi:hypothetical protein